MSRREDDHFLRCFFAEPRLRRREMLAFADPAVPTKTLQNWVDRGLFDAQFALGHAEDLRTQAAEREANEALGRKRLWSGFDVLKLQLLNELSMLGLPLTLVDELAPLALRMAQSRLAAAGGDVLARWASGLPSVVEIGRGPAGVWCVELVPAVALLPWTAAPPAAAEGHPRPYLIARLDVARLLDQLLPALAAEPASPRPPRPCLGSAGVSTGECHAQS